MDYKRLIKILKKGINPQYLELLKKGNDISAGELTRLRKMNENYPWQELLGHFELQKKAEEKFPDARAMVFTRKGLEQSSSELLSRYHGEISQGYNRIADLCCGVGSDLRQLAREAEKVVAIDLDNDTLECARYNCQNFDNITYSQGKAEEFAEEVDLIYADPDRRPGGRRRVGAEDIQPALEKILNLYQRNSRALLVKLSPALDYETVEVNYFGNEGKWKGIKHSWDFISEKGVVKEILLRVGEIATSSHRQAVLLPEGKKLTGSGLEIIAESDWMRYLFEPARAVIRSHLVQKLGQICNCCLVNRHLAVLTAQKPVETVWGRWYLIEEVMPYNRKRLQRYLREHEVGELVVKTRGFGRSAEEERQRYKLAGKNRMILLILRRDKGHEVLVLREQ